MSTPMRRMLPVCCARAASGRNSANAAGAPPSAVRNVRLAMLEITTPPPQVIAFLAPAKLACFGAKWRYRSAMTDAPTSTETPFWRFSLNFYRQADVSDACIALQDTCGVDVNLLL